MSKVKSPKEKKELSLRKDRRNLYGECPTSSRKNIRKGKQRSHMQLRRSASEELRSLKGSTTEIDADRIEGRARDRVVALARSAFKKIPDAPLASALDRKSKRRNGEVAGPIRYNWGDNRRDHK